MITGKYKYIHRRGNSVIATGEIENMVVDVGANALLDVMFYGASQSTAWFIGLIEDNSPVLDQTDALDNHPGWTEIFDRQQWAISSNAVNREITGQAVFTAGAAGDVAGAFLCNIQTGTSGTLHSQQLFNAPVNMISGDTLTVYYTSEERYV